ncbi:MAG: hypothetical protein RL095_1537 [Verrucomicrobiota bacterium]|jgi:two-component system chemotaxis sensor kinase CheA
MNEMNDPEMIGAFVEEAKEQLEVLSRCILELERGTASVGTVDIMFRAAHSIKGAAGFLEFTETVGLTHRLETVLDQVRKGKFGFSPPVLEGCLRAADTLLAVMERISSSGSEAGADMHSALTAMDAILAMQDVAISAQYQIQSLPRQVSLLPESKLSITLPNNRGKLRIPPWASGQIQALHTEVIIEAAENGEAAWLLHVELKKLFRPGYDPLDMHALLSRRVSSIFTFTCFPKEFDLFGPLEALGGHLILLIFTKSDITALLNAVDAPDLEACQISEDEPVHVSFRRSADDSELLAVIPEMVPNIAAWASYMQETLSLLDHLLMDLEKGAMGMKPEVFRHLHSLKSAAAAMGLRSLTRISHQCESLLSSDWQKSAEDAARRCRVLFLGKDLMALGVERVEAGVFTPLDCREFEKEIQSFLQRSSSGEQSVLPRKESSDLSGTTQSSLASPPEGVKKARDKGLHVYHVLLRLEKDVPMPDLRLYMACKQAADLGEILQAKPAIEALEAGLPDIAGMELIYASSFPAEKLKASFQVDQIAEVRIEDLPVIPSAPDPSAPKVAGRQPQDAVKAPGVNTETVRVDAARLDQLLNTVGEMVIARARVSSLSDSITQAIQVITGRRGTAAADEAVLQLRDAAARLGEAVQELGRHSGTLQNAVMKARMVPVAPLFQRFQRLVRDVSKECGKQACLRLRGESIELDKKIIDELVDPLTHLIRNSIDHGLESPDIRRQRGKDSEGTVLLEAFHQGGRVCIRCSDDGAGIAIERVRAKAVEKSLISAEAAARLSVEEVHELIFMPGFSTAAKLSNISGRGVGMDIVRTKVQQLKGSINIESEEGKGSAFLISLPLTLAMIDSLLVSLGGVRYAFPLSSVREIIEFQPSEVHVVAPGSRVIRIREEFATMLDPQAQFGMALGIIPGPVRRAVILKGRGQARAFPVDQVLGSQEIVVKPLPPEFADVRGISGATVLGDGGIALIFDAETLSSS